jgi:CRISPR-associated endonuclease Csn1
MCIYTGKLFSLSDALNGNEIDIDHIIPKSLLFDDSQSNKVLTFRWINQEKGDMTAYDYMASKGKQALDEYIERVNSLFEKGVITKAKRDKLLISGKDIPEDFIERNLRETQYVSKKAREILQQISKNVWATSGSVTQYLRRLWGWNDILQNLQLKRIKEIIPNPLEEGITEIKEFETIDGQIHHKEVIKDWDKRDDHRHHAIDALVVACTKQGYIQRLNTLSAKTTRDELYKKVSERKEEFRESLSLIDKYFILEKPFLTNQVEEKVEKIIVSYKQGKKVATYGKRFIIKDGKKIPVQKNILVPRGSLSEETIYGKIKILEKNKPLKYIFNYPHLIFKDYIRELVEQRLKEYNNDVDKALDSLKKNPIYLKDNKTKLEYATCYKEEYVVKYPLEKITKKDLPYIVDSKIREILEDKLKQHNNNEKEAFKEVYFNEEKKIPIKSVRIFTGLSIVEPIKSNENNYGFVKPGNNHHLAIYLNENGKKQIHICTFWHAVERKKYGFPIVIEETNLVWEKIKNNPNLYPQSFIKKLPEPNLKLIQKFEQNELFILRIKDFDLDFNDKLNVLTKYIYRVQKISSDGNGLETHL